MKVSVLAVFRHNDHSIYNLIDGLQRSDYPPDELLIMAPENFSIIVEPLPNFPVHIVQWNEPFAMTVGAALNRLVWLAQYEALIFLDASGQFGTWLLRRYQQYLATTIGLVYGPVIPEDAIAASPDFSLGNFAISKPSFEFAGGFEEASLPLSELGKRFLAAVTRQSIPIVRAADCQVRLPEPLSGSLSRL